VFISSIVIDDVFCLGHVCDKQADVRRGHVFGDATIRRLHVRVVEFDTKRAIT